MAGIPAASAGEATGTGQSRSCSFRAHEQAGLDACIAAPAREQAVDRIRQVDVQEAAFLRRIGASVYEALLIAALLIAVGFALLPLVTPASALYGGAGLSRSLYAMSPAGRMVSAIAMIAASAGYCAGLWSGGRRTLAMKTWSLAMATASGEPVGVLRALLRYLTCWIGPVLFIAGFVALPPSGHERWSLALLAVNYAWALIDRDGRFLQDRIAGTRLVRANR